MVDWLKQRTHEYHTNYYGTRITPVCCVNCPNFVFGVIIIAAQSSPDIAHLPDHIVLVAHADFLNELVSSLHRQQASTLFSVFTFSGSVAFIVGSIEAYQ